MYFKPIFIYNFPEIILFLFFIILLFNLLYNWKNNSYDYFIKLYSYAIFLLIVYLFISYKWYLICPELIFYNTYQFCISKLICFEKLVIGIVHLSFIILLLGYFSQKKILVLNYMEFFYFKEFLIIFFISMMACLWVLVVNNLFYMYILIEIISLCYYIIPVLGSQSNLGIEAGLKYFSYGTFFSILFIYSLSLLYFRFGTLNISTIEFALIIYDPHSLMVKIIFLFFILFFFFKLAIFPFHIWLIDIFRGTSTFVVSFFAITSKITFIFLFIKIAFSFSIIFTHISNILSIIVVCSLFYSTIAGLTQLNLLYLLGLSSIFNFGIILLSIIQFQYLGYVYAINYLIIYIFLNFGIFAVLYIGRCLKNNRIVEIQNIEDLNRLFNSNIMLALCFGSFILSVAGIPPFAGFFGKVLIFKLLFNNGNYLLLFLLIINNLIATVYYLRLIQALFVENEEIKNNIFILNTVHLILICGFVFIINLGFFFFQGFILNVLFALLLGLK